MGISCAQVAECQQNVAKECHLKSKETQPPRIGIYAGTFNPVHAGHIAFALQAMERANLDKIYFLPERKPRHKTGVEHFAHRVAMLRLALKPHNRLDVLELEDISFTPGRTLNRLKRRFKDAQFILLFGSDVVAGLPSWPGVEHMLIETELVIGARDEDKIEDLVNAMRDWEVQAQSTHVLASCKPYVSSTSIREALRKQGFAQGLLASVARYSNRHWLYVSVA